MHSVSLSNPLNSYAKLNYLKLNFLFFNFFFLVFSLFFLYFRVFSLNRLRFVDGFRFFFVFFFGQFSQKGVIDSQTLFCPQKKNRQTFFSVCLSSFSAVVQLFSFARLTSSAKPEAL